MAYYINQDSKGDLLPIKGKLRALINDGAEIIKEPEAFLENLVCVVEMPYFDAAVYAYNLDEMRGFKESDGRKKSWMIHNHAEELSGYSK